MTWGGNEFTAIFTSRPCRECGTSRESSQDNRCGGSIQGCTQCHRCRRWSHWRRNSLARGVAQRNTRYCCTCRCSTYTICYGWWDRSSYACTSDFITTTAGVGLCYAASTSSSSRTSARNSAHVPRATPSALSHSSRALPQQRWVSLLWMWVNRESRRYERHSEKKLLH